MPGRARIYIRAPRLLRIGFTSRVGRDTREYDRNDPRTSRKLRNFVVFSGVSSECVMPSPSGVGGGSLKFGGGSLILYSAVSSILRVS